MNKIRTCWKVVRVNSKSRSKLTSFLISLENGGVVYDYNRWTLPVIKDSKLMVFGTRDAARRFKKRYSEYYCGIEFRVVKCKAEIADGHFHTINWTNVRLDMSDWLVRCGGPSDSIYDRFPVGTLFANKVKLIRE